MIRYNNNSIILGTTNGKLSKLSICDNSIIIEAFKEKDLVNNKIQYGNVDYISKENIYKFY